MARTHDRDAWLRLAAATGLGPRTCGVLVTRFGSPAAVCRARTSELAACRGVGAARADRLRRALDEADPRAVEAATTAAGLTVTTPGETTYPPAVRDSPDAPPALFVRGTLPGPERPCVAVVGTRAASPYGRRIARDLCDALARSGVVVVSGMARGIDGAAHAGSLAGGGPTVAVLGCGADVAYPPEHATLAAEIAANGAVVSEHPPGTPPHPGHFPRRNRIVAALSQVVVVVEAPTSSGAMLTARIAVEINREVLAVPGPVDRGTHAGCHRLLRDGAGVCEGVGDVLARLSRTGTTTATEGGVLPLGEAARPTLPPGPALLVWQALDKDDTFSLDDLVLRTGLSADAVGAALTVLEVDGRALRVPGGYLLPS